MRTIGITGVAGFIGSNLADRLLLEGHRVVGIDNLAYGVREQVPDGVDFRLADIRSPQLAKDLEGIDVLFHLAAKNCIADCQTDPVETSDINVTGSVNVFRAAVEAGVGKVVYAESSALYEGATRLPTPEEDVSPQSFYATSKFAEAAFADAFARFAGLRTTALRYFCVYGPRQDYRRTIPPVMSAFVIKLLRGERPTIYGDGSKRRDFIYVDDVNDFHLRCIDDARTDGGVYNLGSGVSVSVLETYRTIARLLHSPLEPLFANDLAGEARENLADITRATNLGWRPKIALDEGLQRSIAFIRATADRSSPPFHSTKATASPEPADR